MYYQKFERGIEMVNLIEKSVLLCAMGHKAFGISKGRTDLSTCSNSKPKMAGKVEYFNLNKKCRWSEKKFGVKGSHSVAHL